MSDKQDMLPIGVYADGITPLFIVKTRQPPFGGYQFYEDTISGATGYQFVSSKRGVKAAHLIPFPSLTRKGMLALYRKVLDDKVPIPLDSLKEEAVRESTCAFQYNCRRREHVGLRGFPAGFDKTLIQLGQPIPEHYKPFLTPMDPNQPAFAGIEEGGEPTTPFSFVYAFRVEDLNLSSVVLDRLTKLVDDHPAEHLKLGVCQVALLNYIFYQRKWAVLMDKFERRKPIQKVDHIPFIIAFHHLLSYTEWTGVAFHANPFRFAAAFIFHEKKMRRPVPTGNLTDGLEESEAQKLEADLASFDQVDAVSPLLPSDLIGSTTRPFERSLESFKPFASSTNPVLQTTQRPVAIRPTLDKLWHVRTIGHPNYLNQKYTHRLIPVKEVKPTHRVEMAWGRLAGFTRINEEAYSHSWRVMFPALYPNATTCASMTDVLTPGDRIWSGHPTNHLIRAAPLKETMRLCCSTDEDLAGPLAPPPPPNVPIIATGKKRSARAARLDERKPYARVFSRRSKQDDEEKVAGWLGMIQETSRNEVTTGIKDKEYTAGQTKPRETLISQKAVLEYLQAKGHREGIDYTLLHGAPVAIDVGQHQDDNEGHDKNNEEGHNDNNEENEGGGIEEEHGDDEGHASA